MNREELFQLQDKVIEAVEIPEWKTTLHVRSLTAGEKATWETGHLVDVQKKDGPKTFEPTRERLKTLRERLVELATCNPDGSRYFKDGDFSQLAKMNSKAVSRLYDVAMKLSGISKEDAEEVEKNLEAVAATD